MSVAESIWRGSAGTIVEGIPSGEDRNEVREWVHGVLPYRDGAMDRSVVHRILGSMSWHRVEQTRRFWEDEPGRLQRVAASLGVGLWNLRVPMAMAARWSPSGLELWIGAFRGDVRPVLHTVAANVSQVEIAPAPGKPAPPGAAGVDLWAMAADYPPEDMPGLLDRLCDLNGVGWTLEVLLLPVAPAILEARCNALNATADRLADRLSRQVQLDPHTTMTREDPAGRRIADALADEHRRTEAMLRSGAFQTVVRLGAADREQQAAAMGAATGSAPSPGCHWLALTDTGTSAPMPVSFLASTELTDVLRPPKKDTLGLPSRRWFPLDDHPEPLGGAGPALKIGTTDRGAPLQIPMAAMTSHVLLTGGSGSGKSSHLAALLHQLHQAGVPFLVIEPVKNEYCSLDIPGLTVWRPGAADPGMSWAINPFEVPTGIGLTTHLDRVVGLVRQSLGLPDPLPHLFETALQRAYVATGWDLSSGRNLLYGEGAEYPTLSEVLDICLELPTELGYESQIRGNLRAATLARLGGLTRGPRGRLLDTASTFPVAEVLSGPVVANFDAIGDDHVRALLVQIVLLRVISARVADPRPDLVHVTAIEEGHRVLGAHDDSLRPGEADPVGQAADMVGNMLGEIRSSGEGVIVVDQSAGSLVRAALVNTSTKISLRSVDRADHEALSSSMGLEVEQQGVFSTLSTHEALVSWEGMDRPVRGKVVARLLTPSAPTMPLDLGPAHLEHVPNAVAAAAALLVRSQPTGERAAWSHLLDEIEAHLPGADPVVVVDVLEDVIRREVTRLARARRWVPAIRDAAAQAVIDRRDVPGHPRRLMLSGSLPLPACEAVCPRGGCLAGELVADEAQQLSKEGFMAIQRLLPGSVLSHRVRRRVLAVLPQLAPAELIDLAERCLVAQACDPWVDESAVTAIINAMRS